MAEPHREHGSGVPLAGPPPRFAALRNPACRPYLLGSALGMMGDNTEHVITYLVLWQWFHSPILVAFQVLSHWTPSLFGGIYAGGLADKHDCRRLIQTAQMMYMSVSIAWGVMFVIGFRSVALACVLLIIHGSASALWSPAEQLMLHDFVGRDDLESAVRLNATFRSLGVLAGPVAGAILLALFSHGVGMFVNVAAYLPLTIFLFRTHYTGHTRSAESLRRRLTFRGAWEVLRYSTHDPVLLAMIALGGMGSFFIGTSLQTFMPEFADHLGADTASVTYEMLLFATGAGAVVGGVLLEAVHVIRPTVPAAIVSTLVYGASIALFTVTNSLPLALVLLFLGGFGNLANMSISQTVVQLMAPAHIRGQVIGVYSMSALGLRIGSAFTVGFFAVAVGVPAAQGISAIALCVAVLLLAGVIVRGYRARGGLAAGGLASGASAGE